MQLVGQCIRDIRTRPGLSVPSVASVLNQARQAVLEQLRDGSVDPRRTNSDLFLDRLCIFLDPDLYASLKMSVGSLNEEG